MKNKEVKEGFEENLKTKLKIFDISFNSIFDGEGTRVVLFLQECSLRCSWCHLPHSRLSNSPLLYNNELCDLCGNCVEICSNAVHSIKNQKHFVDRKKCTLCGDCINSCHKSSNERQTGPLYLPTKEYIVEDLFDKIKPHLSIVKDIGGITLSGGEALLQSKGIRKLLTLCKEYNIHTCIETSGTLPINYYHGLKELVDSWIFGMRFIINKSQDIKLYNTNCHNYKYLLEEGYQIYPNLTVIPNYTDTDYYLKMCMNFFKMHNISLVYLNFWNPETSHYYDLSGITKEFTLSSEETIYKSKKKVINFFQSNHIAIEYIENI